jgi:NADH-quinone oxidoreductase subunit H
MRAPLWVIPFLAAFAALVGLSGCHLDEAPDLVTVHRVDPDRASAGDHLLVSGEGFPEGRAGTITFRGDVNYAGLPAQKNVRITARGVPSGRNSLRLVFDSALEARFLRGAPHATFHGDLRVTFAPSASGLATVSGAAKGIRFDVLPSVADAPDDVANTGLAFLGIAPAEPEPGIQGLRVAEVDPEGRAALAGIRVGDLLTEFDGVSVLSSDDVRARAGQRLATALVERGGKLLPPLSLDVVGLAELSASDLVAAAALVLLACAVLVLPATRFGIVLRWAERLSDERRRRRGSRLAASRVLPELILALLHESADRRAAVAAAALVLMAILSCFVLLAVGRPLVSPDVDLLVLALSASMALLVTRTLEGGLSGLRFSPVAAFRSTLRTAACLAPALLAIGAAVLAGGRFVIAEMVGDQGGMPWRWAAMQNPGLFGLAIVLVASAAPEASDRRPELPMESAPPTVLRAVSVGRMLLRLAEWTYLWTMCGLAVALFLGGWRLPFVAPWASESNHWLLALGAALFTGKLVATVCAVGAMRRLSSGMFVEHVARIAARWVVPSAAVALLVALGWAAALDGARSRMAADGAGYALAALSAVLLGYAARVAWARKAPPLTAVNPWL